MAFIGVAIGVMVLIISMAIMNGTAKEFENKLFTMNYPLSIYPRFENSINKNVLVDLKKEFPKLKFSPYLDSQIILQNGDTMNGGVIFGVNQKDEAQINSIYKKAVKGISLSNMILLLEKV